MPWRHYYGGRGRDIFKGKRSLSDLLLSANPVINAITRVKTPATAATTPTAVKPMEITACFLGLLRFLLILACWEGITVFTSYSFETAISSFALTNNPNTIPTPVQGRLHQHPREKRIMVVMIANTDAMIPNASGARGCVVVVTTLGCCVTTVTFCCSYSDRVNVTKLKGMDLDTIVVYVMVKKYA